nr:hypothetical protein [Candidatus Njordarchaeota archaeon]
MKSAKHYDNESKDDVVHVSKNANTRFVQLFNKDKDVSPTQ